MTFRHLNIFICVCDELNMSKAAKKLYVSQPSISQAIQELESYYNTQLFERLGKKLYITYSGKKLLNYARHIVHLMEEAERNMNQLHEESLIRVGATVTIGTYLLCDLLVGFKKAFEKVEITSIVDNTKNIVDKILVDEIDCGLIEGLVTSTDLEIHPFMTDELVLIYPKSHEFENKEEILIEDLINYPFIMRESGSGTREIINQALIKNEIILNIIGEYNNFELIKKAVMSNLGLSFISKKAIEEELKNGLLGYKKVKDLKLVRTFSIVFHKNKFKSAPLENFIEFVRENSLINY